MSTTPTSSGAPTKVSRKDLTIIPVLAFKPPCVVQQSDDPEGAGTPTLVYVDEQGNERRLKSTKTLWRTVDGNPGAGRRPQGFDGKDGKRRYWIYASGKGAQEEAISFTDFPHNDYLYSRATGVPETASEDLHLQIDFITGSIKILQVPVGVRQAQLDSLVRAIDAVTHLEPGQSLGGGAEVLTVAGNRITCSVPIAEDRGVGRQMMP